MNRDTLKQIIYILTSLPNTNTNGLIFGDRTTLVSVNLPSTLTSIGNYVFSGYSSLASLQILRFDVIKLDKSLIDFIGTTSGESLIKHTVAFAKESGMKVVAEGVEKKEQLDFLREINCDYIQGFYFAAPMPQKEFDKLLTGDSKI